MVDYRGMKIGKQTTWGTTVATTTVVNAVKVSYKQNRNMNYQETMGYLEPITQSVGTFKGGGDVEMQAVPDEFCYFLASLFGSPTSTTLVTNAAYKHIYKPSSDHTFWTTDLYEDTLGKNLNSFTVTKAVLKLVPGKDAFWTFTYIVRSDERLMAVAAPTFTTYKKSFHVTDNTFTLYGAGNTKTRAVEYTFEKKIGDDNYPTTSQFLNEPHMGVVTTKVSADFQFEDETNLNRFYDGAANSTEPGDDVTEFAFNCSLEGDTLSGGYKYGLTIEIPKLTWDTRDSTTDRREPILEKVSGTPVYDTSNSYGVQITLINRVTSPSM